MNEAFERSYPTPLSNSSLLPLLLLSLASQKHTPDPSTTFRSEYDYIVVGGGAAGSVVASRLSELPGASVLLIEAGRAPPLLTEVPALGRYFRNTDVDWKFITEPQKYTGCGLINRQIGWCTGKMLGGSASLNGMAYVRGNKKNYDDWSAQGAKGWSYDEVYPYFLKLEDNIDPEFLNNGYHAIGGPVTVSLAKYRPKVKVIIQEAAKELGYQILDPNAARQTGFYDRQTNVRNGQRCSSVKAYLVPASHRENLDILLDTMVTKVVIENGQAVGVEFDNGAKRYCVRATKEVIISAGVVNSPKLLMLSGVGPKEELRKFNIPVKADLPVGKNFHDHGGTNLYFTLDHDDETLDEKLANPHYILEYIHKRTGPLASSDVREMAFLSGLNVNPPFDFPNYSLYIGDMPVNSIKKSGLKPEVYNQVVKPYQNRTILSCTVHQLQPRSRGFVTLRSSNPYDSPVIDPNFLEDPRDLEDIVEGLLSCKRLLNTNAFRKLGAKVFNTLVPGCEQFAYNDSEYFRCFTRAILYTYHHCTGTAKMGNPSDPTTVLDPQLRVKNIKGLRVVDGSIMPKVTSGNIHIPIIMIAEKASDMIKRDTKIVYHCQSKGDSDGVSTYKIKIYQSDYYKVFMQ